ncbi:DUF1837 domain-containing protein [Defluviitalea saccharophila]|uniref:DUF1837 domain-containing protein n=1 Tax=Defluviitalea saccharophila TaxID=879970 RepID=A0ABZ2YAP6_9FIRM
MFIQIEHDFSLDLVNENKLNIYHLRVENRKFIYRDLIGFCEGNIIQYVFNRNVVRQANTIAEIQKLFNQARKKFREVKENNDKGAGGELGELLLYLFLESHLKAPKLLSKMEIKTTRNQYVYGADGVHLYFTKDDEGKPIYQFIIGESKIKNDILDASRIAFDSIKKTIDEIDIETCLVSGEILKEVCSKEEAEAIIQMILPSEDVSDKIAIHEKAVGIFIGYTGSYDEDIANSVWNKTLNEKIKKDIERAVSTIKNKIEDLKLKGYSFYCYFLPLNNAEEDRKDILNNIL